MKALTLKAYNELVYETWPEPTLEPGEVLVVRVAACGICGSDVHGIDGSTGQARAADYHGARGGRRNRRLW